MNTLPDDVLCRCLARVPLADRVPAERVCKAWREAFASKAYTVARRAYAELRQRLVAARQKGPAVELRRHFRKTYCEVPGWCSVFQSFYRVYVLHARAWRPIAGAIARRPARRAQLRPCGHRRGAGVYLRYLRFS